MWHQGRSARSRRWAVVMVVAGLLAGACLLPAAASASTPSSTATCTGSLTPDSSGAASGEPNLLDYSFSCSADITTYTVVVLRGARNSTTIDDFEPSPLVLQPDSSPSATQTFTCSPGAGGVPGNGFNCNAPSGTPMTAGNSANGSLDPVDPYCKRLRPGAKPGTPAEPQAQVELIVTDTGGASDGPFTLNLTPACPSVPNFTPYPPPPKPKPTHTCSGSLKHDSSGGVRAPNQLAYRFSCDGDISAYSIIVTRQAQSRHTVDAFAARPLVLQHGGAPSPGERLSCSGRLPGPGFNCSAGSGAVMSAGNSANGSFDLTGPYCQSLPPGTKPGTPAQPQAQVELLITDATGAQRGPFALGIKPACPPAPTS